MAVSSGRVRGGENVPLSIVYFAVDDMAVFGDEGFAGAFGGCCRARDVEGPLRASSCFSLLLRKLYSHKRVKEYTACPYLSVGREGKQAF